MSVLTGARSRLFPRQEWESGRPYGVPRLAARGLSLLVALAAAVALLMTAPPARATGSWAQVSVSRGSLPGEVRAIAAAPDGKVYVGGIFSETEGLVTRHLTVWDPQANSGAGGWSAMNAINTITGANGQVVDAFGLLPEIRALAFNGDRSKLYIGGLFSGLARAGVGAFEGIAVYDVATATLSPLGFGIQPGTTVKAIAVAPSGEVYVGGDFLIVEQPSGTPLDVDNVAVWNPGTSTWSGLGPTVDLGGGLSRTGVGVSPSNGELGQPSVEALAISGTKVIVAGDFDLAGPIAANGIAAFEPSSGTWSPMGTGVDNVTGEPVHSVRALTVDSSGQRVYVGGRFGTAGGQPADNVAMFDMSSNTWSPLGAGLPSYDRIRGQIYVAGMATAPDGKVYVVGNFKGAALGDKNEVAVWNPTGAGSWESAGFTNNSGQGGTYPGQRAVAVTAAGQVYVGGNNPNPWSRLNVWTPTPRATVSFDLRGGSSGPAAITGQVVGSVVAIPSTVPTRSGYTFAGWNTDANGTGTNYATGGSLTVPAGGSTLFAQWLVASPPNTGSGSVQPSSGSATATTGGVQEATTPSGSADALASQGLVRPEVAESRVPSVRVPSVRVVSSPGSLNVRVGNVSRGQRVTVRFLRADGRHVRVDGRTHVRFAGAGKPRTVKVPSGAVRVVVRTQEGAERITRIPGVAAR